MTVMDAPRPAPHEFAGCMREWVVYFTAVAAQHPAGEWHKKQAVIRDKKVMAQLIAGLERLDSKTFKLVVSKQ